MSTPVTIDPTNLAAVAQNSASVIRKMAAALQEKDALIADLQVKVAGYEGETRIRKIASTMEERNLNSELSFEEKCASLRENLTEGSLDSVEKAVEMAAPGNVKMASVSDEDSGAHLDALTLFCLGQN